jgi:hypothetical protein
MIVAALVALAAVACLAPSAGAGEAPKPKKPITDATVAEAIEKGKQWLIKQAKPDGSFSSANDMKNGETALVFMTLAYMGEHPTNRPYMDRGLMYLMNVPADTGFDNRQGYAVPIRVMALSYVYRKLGADRRNLANLKAREDIMRIMMGQQSKGGWRYELKASESFDFSVSQWPLLAMWEARRAGIEFPDPKATMDKALKLYLEYQQKDGGWYYDNKTDPSSGSMTAAGAASLFILDEFLEPNSGCPCNRGASPQRTSPIERSMDSSLEWLGKFFTTAKNPNASKVGAGERLYWLYCVERVGLAAGYKYFGDHNWYKEGVETLLGEQKEDGSFSNLRNTCFSLLFLYKGQAPILYNKLRFDGTWNAHRRDAANLVHYIETKKEQLFHWQIVQLKAPLDELHDAPILYITPETEPKFTDDELAKLRAFTDTGGTILLEASCGNPNVRRWTQDFIKKGWPEWQATRLAAEHGVWSSDQPMRTKPEILGLDDGVRTAIFYSPDDISCAWQTQALTQKEYLFQFGMNLYRYATDGSPLRGRLSGNLPPASTRYADPVKAGPRAALKIARVQHGGNWAVGANYKGFAALADYTKKKAAITLDVTEPKAVPFNTGGVAAKDLAGYDVAFVAGSLDVTMTPEEREALKAYAAGGGFVWAEAVTGSREFDVAFRKLAGEIGWKLVLLPGSHPLMHGKMDPGVGFNLTMGVQFRDAVKKDRIGFQKAEWFGIHDGEKLVGVYSPYDTVFSAAGYDAYKCRGYKTEDALAVGANLAVYVSTLPK